MKNLLCIYLLLFLTSCSTNYDLNGRWTATGYVCEGILVPEEFISITQNGKDLVAIKEVGDNCIMSGEETWNGRISGNQIKAFVYGINPSTLEKESFALPIEIVTNNALKIDLGEGNKIRFK